VSEEDILKEIVETQQRRFDRAAKLRGKGAVSEDDMDVLNLALLQAKLYLAQFVKEKK
jgi:hypothetical protein